MIRPPPRSTLFPYTTLSRSSRAIATTSSIGPIRCAGSSVNCAIPDRFAGSRHRRCRRRRSPRSRRRTDSTRRSEEHTSELQSRLHLVCRLLLEKKKKKVVLIWLILYLNVSFASAPSSTREFILEVAFHRHDIRALNVLGYTFVLRRILLSEVH